MDSVKTQLQTYGNQIQDYLMRSLDEETLSRVIASHLYLKSNSRPDRDFSISEPKRYGIHWQ